MPDQFWDAKAGVKGDDLAKSFNELSAFKAAEDVRRLALPQTEKDYKLALPKDFQPPAGVEFKLDEADPLFAQARTWAKENGLSQEAFEKGIGMIAARDVATQQMLTEARNTEIAKLGVNGTARVTALNTFLDAKGLPALKGMMVTADIVQQMEKMVALVAAGGNFSQQHRSAETAEKISDEEYAKMSPSEKRAYAAQFPQPAQQQNGRAA